MYPDSRLLRYNPLRNCDKLAKLFTGVIVQGIRAVTVVQALAQRNCTADNDLRDCGPEKSKLNLQKLLDEQWAYQQNKELEINKAKNALAKIQQSLRPKISLGLSTPNEQQPSMVKTRNNIVEGTSKHTNCNCNHRPTPKCTKITKS